MKLIDMLDLATSLTATKKAVVRALLRTLGVDDDDYVVRFDADAQTVEAFRNGIGLGPVAYADVEGIFNGNQVPNIERPGQDSAGGSGGSPELAGAGDPGQR